MKQNQRGYGVRRQWWPPSPGMTTGLALMALLAGLWGTGVLRPETFGFGDKGDKKAQSRVGWVAIPMSGEMIPAYTQLTRDHFWDAKQGDFAVVYMPPSVVTPEMIRNMGTIVGRVMSRDKPPGYVFTEADFLPQGTRPGLVGGIPPGKRAIRFALALAIFSLAAELGAGRRGAIAAAGDVAGIGLVCGRPCMIIANDATVRE